MNLGAGCEITIRELVELIMRLTGYRGPLVWDPRQPGWAAAPHARYLSGCQAARGGARTPLLEGLRQTVEWYRRARPTRPPVGTMRTAVTRGWKSERHQRARAQTILLNDASFRRDCYPRRAPPHTWKRLRTTQALWGYRGFVLGMVVRDFRGRYFGSVLGASWAIINPLAQILIFTVVFSQVMRARLTGVSNDLAYGLFLCAGLSMGVSRRGLDAKPAGRSSSTATS